MKKYTTPYTHYHDQSLAVSGKETKKKRQCKCYGGRALPQRERNLPQARAMFSNPVVTLHSDIVHRNLHDGASNVGSTLCVCVCVVLCVPL